MNKGYLQAERLRAQVARTAMGQAQRAAGMHGPTKHQAPAQAGLSFWAEPTDGPGGRIMYAVVSQAEGYPASDAHDDYFLSYADADAIAQQYAREYPNH